MGQAIDAALLRPGRLQEHIYIGLPTKQDCLDILSLRMEGWRDCMDQDMDINQIAETLVDMGASGADIDGICREACLHSVRRAMELPGLKREDDPSPMVSTRDFEVVMKKQLKFSVV